MSGSGLAADSSGDIYAITSNGSWDGTSNFSDSFVKLSPNLIVLDYFTPYNQATLSANDQDLGSGGHCWFPINRVLSSMKSSVVARVRLSML